MSNESLTQLLENVNIPIAVAKSDKIINWLNNEAKKIFDDIIIGKNFVSHFKLKKKITKVLSSQIKSLQRELKVIPLYRSKKITRYVLLFNKLSETTYSAHNIAHDLNNIFTSILNSIELIKQKPNDFERNSFLLNNIENSSMRAAEIIEDTLVKERKESYTIRKINITGLIDELANNIKPTLVKEVEITTNIDPSIHAINGKYNDLYRVLMNMCVNAREAVEQKGKIFITAQNCSIDTNNNKTNKNIPAGDYVLIKVKDTGVGIKKEDLPKIFSSKFSTKQKHIKSGLGLNIVSEIIKKHNGFIQVESKLNEWTEFSIYLPAIIKKELSEKFIEGKTILIAEDEYTLRELLRELLESYNYKIIEAADGSELIEKLKLIDNIDLFVIDRKMPGVDGFQCIEKIREIKKDIPIILASGSPTDEKNQMISKLKIDKVINKPYDFENLLDNIERLIC